MILALFLPALAAAPRFVGDAADLPIAAAAWAAAEACTGRVPTVGAEASIARDLPAPDGAGLVGLASWPAAAPGRIRLAARATYTVIAHEVAHAWVSAGPRALVEGRTEALTACIQRQRPDLFDDLMDRYSELGSLPDLREWDAPVSDTGGMQSTLDAYLGAFRLFRAIATVVPPERLWAAELRSWEALEGLLATAGPRGATALAVIRGGADAQRTALLDADRDGLSFLYEQLNGTDPARYDTDGDGWWDGAPPGPPVGAVPLPQTHQPVCLSLLPEDVSTMVLELGGQLGGMDIPARIQSDGLPGMLVTWSSGWQRFPGGVWARAVDASVPNARCGMRTDVTLRALDDVPLGSLDTLAEAIERAMTTIGAETGLPPTPVVVSVEGTAMYVDRIGDQLRVPLAAVRRLDAGPGRDALARQLAALAVVRDAPQVHRTAIAAALVSAVFPGAATPLLDAPHYEIGEWTRARRRCDAGWTALLAGKCPSPARP